MNRCADRCGVRLGRDDGGYYFAHWVQLSHYNSHNRAGTARHSLLLQRNIKKGCLAACAIKAHDDLEEQVGEERAGTGE